jgi:diguanylate cyclase (GGDEF)-like protein
MQLGPGFLRSRIGRRVFWTLLWAALLPLAVFGGLGYGVLAERLLGSRVQQLQEAAKYAGLGVHDRLLSAQSALAALAAAGPDTGRNVSLAVEPSTGAPLAGRKMFRAVSVIGREEGAVTGAAGLATLWRELSRAAGGRPGAQRLWWQAADDGREARVVLAVRAGERWWVGELAAEYLWGDLRDADAEVGTCVTDAHGQRLMCPAGTTAGRDARGDRVRRDGATAASWSLFTRADFGTVDWVFTRHAADARLLVGGLPLEQAAWKGALFSLLLLAGLSLLLARRTLVPLERLMEGARRLARRDWSCRVRVPEGDEFGQLAGAFNDMAARIERQMQALKLQSDIDREILAGVELAPVLGQVMARLQALAPQARVGLLVRSPAGDRWTRVASAHAAAATLELDAQLLQCIEAEDRPLSAAHGRLAARLLGLPDERLGECVQLVPARTAEGTRALLMRVGASPDEDHERELLELADRVAVMLVAFERERRLQERAVRDSLTGLLNRAGLLEAIDQRLAQAGDAGFVLAFIDLDGFKTVNDSRGHSVGDALLCEVAGLLRTLAPAEALVARPGGDEFVLLLAPDCLEADRLAQTVCQRLAEPIVLEGQMLRIGASIGLVCSPDHGRERVELMRRADLAMYAAKGAGRGRHMWFEPVQDERAAERAWLQSELPRAIERDELLLHFQPRVVAGGRRLAALEALVRWQHPQRGLIPPLQFIPLAEEIGQIEALGHWVLEAACRQQRRWRDAGLRVPRVAVNVSALQLAAPDFADRVLRVLRRHGLAPADLELELTESLFVGDAEDVCSRLQPLRDAGVLVALDDFGTGFSSLSSLHRLPVDVLKIDRSFVVDLGRRESADAVTRSIVVLAQALGKHVVAEGVETQAQIEHLSALGCEEMQGYFFARPLPAAQVADWLQAAPAEAAES